MVEVIVCFESLGGAETENEAENVAPVRGTVKLFARPDKPPIRFDGWLQLLGLLESLSSMTDLNGELPRPIPSVKPC